MPMRDRKPDDVMHLILRSLSSLHGVAGHNADIKAEIDEILAEVEEERAKHEAAHKPHEPKTDLQGEGFNPNQAAQIATDTQIDHHSDASATSGL